MSAFESEVPPAGGLPLHHEDDAYVSRSDAQTRGAGRMREVGLREELIQDYMRVARSLAVRYQNSDETLDDRIEAACLGLVKAIDGYDPDTCTSFDAHAVPAILGELRRPEQQR